MTERRALLKLRTVVNFIIILQAAFAPIFLCQKLQSKIVTRLKLWKTLLCKSVCWFNWQLAYLIWFEWHGFQSFLFWFAKRIWISDDVRRKRSLMMKMWRIQHKVWRKWRRMWRQRKWWRGGLRIKQRQLFHGGNTLHHNCQEKGGKLILLSLWILWICPKCWLIHY
jgi:hypothetical protein